MSKTFSGVKKRTNIGKFLFISLAVLILDQASKFIARRYFAYSTNTGAAFSIFQGSADLISWISILMVGVILYFYDEASKNKFSFVGAALMLGGILGNLVDRITLGHVVDFIDLRFWPSFNLADSAAVIGAVLIAVYLIKKE